MMVWMSSLTIIIFRFRNTFDEIGHPNSFVSRFLSTDPKTTRICVGMRHSSGNNYVPCIHASAPSSDSA